MLSRHFYLFKFPAVVVNRSQKNIFYLQDPSNISLIMQHFQTSWVIVNRNIRIKGIKPHPYRWSFARQSGNRHHWIAKREKKNHAMGLFVP